MSKLEIITNNVLFIVLISIMALAAGVLLGAIMVSEKWKADCEKVGKHLSGDVVYVCIPEAMKK